MKEPPINCAYDELRDVVNLVPHPQNPNTHSDSQIELLAKIIQHQGWRNPVVVSERSGFIVAGHGRLMAAEKLGLKQVPVDLQAFDNEADELAHLVADNRIAELAETDRSVLADLIAKLDNGEYDLTLTGFEESSLDELMLAAPPAEGLTDEDEVPEPPENPTTVEGDIWLLGNHRLMCGDSTSVDAVKKLMDGEKADMVFTSPPYNANTSFSNCKNAGKLYNKYEDNKSETEYVEFCTTVLNNCFMFTSGYIFWNVNYNSNTRSSYIKQILQHVEYLDETICWKKQAMPVPHGLTRTWEPIFVFKNSNEKERIGTKNKTEFNYWDISNTGALSEKHRAAFPVNLPRKAVELCRPQLTLDPFCGSGTTVLACELNSSRCCGMELDPVYCDVTIKRWQDFTGKEATHAVTGKTFNESH